MMPFNRFLYSFLGFGICCAQSLCGGAFVQEKGKGFTSLELYHYQTAAFWNVHGKRQPSNNKFVKNELNSFTEYGITSEDTLTAKAMYADIKETVNPDERGFEDFEFGWKHLLCKKDDHRFSMYTIVIIPSGPSDKPSLRYGRLGGQFDLLYSRSFKWKERYGFFDFGLGYRVYSGYPSDQIRGATALGYDLTKHIQIIGSSWLEYGVFNGRSFTTTNNILLNANYRLLKADITARYRFSKKVSGVIGYYRHVWGENVGTGGSIHGGLWIDF